MDAISSVVKKLVNTRLTMYNKDWKRESVTFRTPFSNLLGALCVDCQDNVHVGNYNDKKIAVFRPEGGVPIKKIASPGLGPYVYPSHESQQSAGSDGWVYCESD